MISIFAVSRQRSVMSPPPCSTYHHFPFQSVVPYHLETAHYHEAPIIQNTRENIFILCSIFSYPCSCFITPGNALYYGFLMEVLILVVFNAIVFAFVVRQVIFRPILSTSSSSYKKEAMSRFQLFVTFWVLLGLSWAFGFLAVIPNRKTIIFEVIFCVFTSLQGFLLVALIFTRNSDVQQGMNGARKRLWMKVASSDSKSKSSSSNSGNVNMSYSEVIQMNTSSMNKSS